MPRPARCVAVAPFHALEIEIFDREGNYLESRYMFGRIGAAPSCAARVVARLRWSPRDGSVAESEYGSGVVGIY